MTTHYFTFGQIHTHSFNGKTLDKDFVVEIQQEREGQARKRMFELFGQKWASEYDKKPDMEYFPKGIIKIQ